MKKQIVLVVVRNILPYDIEFYANLGH